MLFFKFKMLSFVELEKDESNANVYLRLSSVEMIVTMALLYHHHNTPSK